jgi:murein DD-endopeptidase MepM/ murein hydrolase activator NlpD
MEPMPTFPFAARPAGSWHNFASAREGQYASAHPACDLAAIAGTEILAVADGTIHAGPYKFAEYTFTRDFQCHSITFAIEVRHEEAGFIARYSEISPNLPEGLGKGSSVREGQVIAFVGNQCGPHGPGTGSMLHFEMYQNVGRLDDLTDKANTKFLHVKGTGYKRRSDLLDPTQYLDAWAASLTGSET